MKNKNKPILLKHIETPIGTMVACATDKGICMLEFLDRKLLETELKDIAQREKTMVEQGESPYFALLEQELSEYFAGKREEFSIPLHPMGTDFQQRVWQVLRIIPYGQTWSYKQQATALGSPQSVRAVANANGMNRLSILIPCHRVIGSNGTLTGYGGGLWRKKFLLELEGVEKWNPMNLKKKIEKLWIVNKTIELLDRAFAYNQYLGCLLTGVIFLVLWPILLLLVPVFEVANLFKKWKNH